MALKTKQSGQALVLILLSLAVVLTLVLFVLARSTTDIAVSSRSEESARAFSAAEAGIENALVIGSIGQVPQIGDANYNASVSSFAEGDTTYNYPIEMNSGDSMTIWFISHDENGNVVPCSGGNCFIGSGLSICWGKPGTSALSDTTPAVEISVFYETTPGDLSTLRIGRTAIDENTNRAPGVNSFTQVTGRDCNISGENYAFQAGVNFVDLAVPAGSYGSPGGLQFARVRMLYNSDQSQPLGVDVSAGGLGGVLPSQGLDISSTGTVGDANRKVQVFQGWPEPPPVFDYAIYSSTGLSK